MRRISATLAAALAAVAAAFAPAEDAGVKFQPLGFSPYVGKHHRSRTAGKKGRPGDKLARKAREHKL